jgi:DNA processing protein
MTSSQLPKCRDLADLFALNSLKGFGPQKFKQLYLDQIAPRAVLADPSLLLKFGKRGYQMREQLEGENRKLREEAEQRAEKQLNVASKIGAEIITYQDSRYPKTVFESNNPIPILYARGNTDVLRGDRGVACVGSRNIREPYSSWHAKFVEQACSLGFSIASGFALGADTIGHKAAVETGGKTICVMPSGLDRPFPPENKDLFQAWMNSTQVVFISEFPFGTGAASLNLRKRNKLIVAAALGVLISQSSSTGGAMNAYRFALEQKKSIATFAHDHTEATSGNLAMAKNEEGSKTTVFIGMEVKGIERWLSGLSSSI